MHMLQVKGALCGPEVRSSSLLFCNSNIGGVISLWEAAQRDWTQRSVEHSEASWSMFVLNEVFSCERRGRVCCPLSESQGPCSRGGAESWRRLKPAGVWKRREQPSGAQYCSHCESTYRFRNTVWMSSVRVDRDMRDRRHFRLGTYVLESLEMSS